MPDFVVRSRKHNPTFHVRLANCTVEHAQSVVDQLNAEPSAPDDLYYETHDTPAVKRPWYRRFC